MISLSFLPVHAQDNEMQTKPEKIISVMYDDSGSMYWGNTTTWAKGNYALQQMAAQLQKQDTMFVTYMSNPGHAETVAEKHIEHQKAIDRIQKHTDIANASPISALDTAVNKLMKCRSNREDSEYWLVIYTNGAFTKNTSDQKTFEEKIQLLQNKKMPNHSMLKIAYISIGKESPVLQGDESQGIYSYTCDNDTLIDVSLKVMDIIFETYHFDSKDVAYIDEHTLEITTPFPLYRLHISLFKGPLTIENIDTRASVQSYQCHSTYPTLEGYLSDTSLSTDHTYSDESKILVPGTYRLHFTQAYDKDMLHITGSPALLIRYEFFNKNEKIAVNEIHENQNLQMKTTLLRADNFKPIDISDPYEDIQQICASSEQMQTYDENMVPSITFTRDDTQIQTTLKSQDKGVLRHQITVSPIPRYTYFITPVNDSVEINPDTMEPSNDILFQVYRDGKLMTNGEDVKALGLKFELTSEHPLLYYDVTYQNDGTVLCEINYGIKNLHKGLSQWLSSWSIKENQHVQLNISMNKKNYLSTAIQFSQHDILHFVIHIVFPLLLMFIFIGFILKPRFPKKSCMRSICVIKDGSHFNSYVQSWNSTPLHKPWSLSGIVPFFPETIVVDHILFQAKGIFKKNDIIVRIRKRDEMFLLPYIKDVSTHECVSFTCDIESCRIPDKKEFHMQPQQLLLLPVNETSYMLYKFTPCTKKHGSHKGGETSGK